MTQKGPRAYIIFSLGEAVEVHDMAKHARERVSQMKARSIDASYSRFSSRQSAEEFAAWHNYKRHLAQEKWRAEAEARRAANYARAMVVPERQLPLWPSTHISSPSKARTFYPHHRRF